MTDPLLTQVVSGVLTGALGAGTSLLGGFRNLQKKVATLEEMLGHTEPRSGLYHTVFLVEDALKKLKRDIDAWEDQPPSWANRLFSRARSSSSSDITSQLQFEERMNVSMRQLSDRISRLADDTEASFKRMERGESSDDLLTKDEYLKDSRVRAEEMIRIREQIATANGLLRGVMSAVGLIDPERPKPPRPGR